MDPGGDPLHTCEKQTVNLALSSALVTSNRKPRLVMSLKDHKHKNELVAQKLNYTRNLYLGWIKTCKKWKATF